jgi:hypothetical protein
MLLVATVVALTIGGVHACAAIVPSGERLERAIVPAVRDADPIIDDVTFFYSTGIAGIGMAVLLHVNSTDHDDLVRAVDAVIETILVEAPFRPIDMGIDITERPRQSQSYYDRFGGPGLGFNNYLPMQDVVDELGLDVHTSNGIIDGLTEKFEARYGTWEELHR